MTVTTRISESQSWLRDLYGNRADEVAQRIQDILVRFSTRVSSESTGPLWTERDVVLITYADQVARASESPLATLGFFLKDENLEELINTVHLLPFYPYSSDDGFSVIDYLQVDPNVGAWDDVARLAEEYDLMFDLVLNHISQHSEWFQKYLLGEAPFEKFFIEANPTEDLTAVVRPRSLPLLTPVETNRGTKHVWTTFSEDQIDLNYGEPEVLLCMIEVLLEYVHRGAKIVRLDAVAFLWKEFGTNCIHLPETHVVVKLLRDVVEAVAPGVLILTETNVPHEENISYFGDCDEARMVYQFSLPPLLLDAFVNEDASAMNHWLGHLLPPQAGTTYFNFTASHDGIGVRPLEGLVPPERIERLAEHVRELGGMVSTRQHSNGHDTPYELNISFVDALTPRDKNDVELHTRRFLASQAVMLSLQGMPALYFHSLVGSRNDLAGVQATRQPRRINRHKYTLDELHAAIHPPAPSLASCIYSSYRNLLAQRIRQPAFHPDARQEHVDQGNSAILAFERTSLDGSQNVLVAVNVSVDPQSLELDLSGYQHELISDQPLGRTDKFELEPGQAVWITS